MIGKREKLGLVSRSLHQLASIEMIARTQQRHLFVTNNYQDGMQIENLAFSLFLYLETKFRELDNVKKV